MTNTRAWVVWGVGVAAYTAAVLQRTSLGVAGIDAAARFHAPAGIIASFVVLQLLVYSGLQVPVGVALDRLGTRRMVTIGALLMAVGQTLMATAHDVPTAMAARVLVGAGDAMTFGSVIRLVPAWFPAARVPLITQLTGLMGQAGQVLAAVPLAALLHGPGWSTAFGAAAVAAALSCVLAATLLQDRPAGAPAIAPHEREPIQREVTAVLRHPGTWLGMFTHGATGFWSLCFAMMWGVPYLVQGEGLSRETASGLLTLLVVLGLVIGPVLGLLTQRHPLRRSNLAIGIALVNLLPWVAVLLWPGRAPLWLLVVLVVGLASGGPGSGIGFDFARTFTPSHRLGAATGVVIMGSFVAGLVSILTIGLVLDRSAGGHPYTLHDFRLAMATQVPIGVALLAALYVTRSRARRRWAQDEGVVVPTWSEALSREFGPLLERLRRR
ncbi:MFS transporter [Arsenicicoccus dermatophilus]|uniref:MFS transporter n=1 Tax=Arsenicicoccus dermatophilus TaxID=1076331 RepID=UPI001F4D2429|nr:MFS transporter [Arsenicicoccus dermatophilus]